MTADELAKHWLLNLVVEKREWLGMVFPTVADQTLNVRSVPHFNSQDYARCLIELFDSSMIRLLREREPEGTPCFIEKRSDAVSLLDQHRSLTKGDPSDEWVPRRQRWRDSELKISFELTALGGETWENVAKPDWSRVIFELRDEVCGEITSPDRNLLMAWIGWYSQINGNKIRLDTVRWQTHADFQILYWKQLPVVHQATFDLESTEKQWPIFEPQWYREWWSNSLRWYKKPWELSCWPR